MKILLGKCGLQNEQLRKTTTTREDDQPVVKVSSGILWNMGTRVNRSESKKRVPILIMLFPWTENPPYSEKKNTSHYTFGWTRMASSLICAKKINPLAWVRWWGSIQNRPRSIKPSRKRHKNPKTRRMARDINKVKVNNWRKRGTLIECRCQRDCEWTNARVAVPWPPLGRGRMWAVYRDEWIKF